VNPQLLTSFPNQNEKLIDFVIAYEKLADENGGADVNRKIVQKAFFHKLKIEGFDIYEMEHTHKEKIKIFALLSCSMDRLLEEAELTRLKIPLKNVGFFH
jgi:hypothetical protein